MPLRANQSKGRIFRAKTSHRSARFWRQILLVAIPAKFVTCVRDLALKWVQIAHAYIWAPKLLPLILSPTFFVPQHFFFTPKFVT